MVPLKVYWVVGGGVGGVGGVGGAELSLPPPPPQACDNKVAIAIIRIDRLEVTRFIAHPLMIRRRTRLIIASALY